MRERLTREEFDALVQERQRAWRAGRGMGPFPLAREIAAEYDVEIITIEREQPREGE